MGEVWRARDSKLGREVAIKTLPEEFAKDEERLARFEREAKLLASLNHPNIATIYGLEEDNGTRFLVLELVEGDTLADRLKRGAIPVEESLKLALQIAEALEAAHEKGVIHRDLKPANIKVTSEGQVKVLDFGLAKAFAASGHVGLSNSPTLSIAATQQGVILGTAGYMSPEQAKGEEVHQTADIWAFGVILIEMLTGREAFAGPSITESLAKILERDAPFDALPTDIPLNIRRLLHRCLEKDPKRRLQHIGDARIEITSAPESPIVREGAPGTQNRWAIPVIALLLVTIAGLVLFRSETAPSPEVRRFQIGTDPGTYIAPYASLALSPDGSQLVYGVVDPAGAVGSELLLIQDLVERFDAQELVSGESVQYPFFSPNGDTVGFDSFNDLRQVSLGGAPTSLVASVDTVGAAWINSDEVVLAEEWGFPLQRAQVGDPNRTALTTLKIQEGEVAHLWPQMLPDDQNVLFTVWSAAPVWSDAEIAVANLESGEHNVVIERGTYRRYARSGHIVFWRSGDLWAVPFDVDRLEIAGEEVRMAEGVRLDGQSGNAHFRISETGTLAYVSGGLDVFEETLIVDRFGTTLVQPERLGATGGPEFSPDGNRVALTMYLGGTYHIGVYDRERDLLRQLTTQDDNIGPSWTPDGNRLTYLSSAAGPYTFYTMSADGSGTPEIVLEGEPGVCCGQIAKWSPDDRYILFTKPGALDNDIWVGSPDSDVPAELLVDDPGDQIRPDWSPSGRHFVYQSTQARKEIYIRPFPDADRRSEQVSVAGGWSPKWSWDGSTIYYASDQGIMSVPFTEGSDPAEFSLGQPTLVLEMTGVLAFDVSPDGKMFVLTREPIESFATEINVVLNWFEELKERVPVP